MEVNEFDGEESECLGNIVYIEGFGWWEMAVVNFYGKTTKAVIMKTFFS